LLENNRTGRREGASAYDVAEFGSELLYNEREAVGDLVEHVEGEGPVLLGRDLALDLPLRHPQLHERHHLLGPR
jgi:hypothetical protein